MAQDPSIQNIREICQAHSCPGYYVGNIPPAKLGNARTSLAIALADEVVALLDTTVFGGAKDGLAICSRGIYFKNILKKPEYVSWDDVRSLTFSVRTRFPPRIEFSNGQLLDTTQAAEIGALMNELQALSMRDVPAPMAWMSVEEHASTNKKRDDVKPTESNPGQESLIDLNDASLEELLTLPGFSRARADLLMNRREIKRGFASIQEVCELLHLEPHIVPRFAERVIVRAPEAPRVRSGSSAKGRQKGREVEF